MRWNGWWMSAVVSGAISAILALMAWSARWRWNASIGSSSYAGSMSGAFAGTVETALAVAAGLVTLFCAIIGSWVEVERLDGETSG